jgi:hypothetical protein
MAEATGKTSCCSPGYQPENCLANSEYVTALQKPLSHPYFIDESPVRTFHVRHTAASIIKNLDTSVAPRNATVVNHEVATCIATNNKDSQMKGKSEPGFSARRTFQKQASGTSDRAGLADLDDLRRTVPTVTLPIQMRSQICGVCVGFAMWHEQKPFPEGYASLAIACRKHSTKTKEPGSAASPSRAALPAAHTRARRSASLDEV